jgi:hypothetical protein
MRLVPGTRVRWAALGAVVGAAAMGGVAWGDVPDSGVIHGCSKASGGSLRVIDQSLGEQCKLGENALDWNQTGPTGPRGPSGAMGRQGPTGPLGPTGPSELWDVTSETGSGSLPADGTEVTVASLAVPPGDYFVSAQATFRSVWSFTKVVGITCFITSSGTIFQRASIEFDTNQSDNSGGLIEVLPVQAHVHSVGSFSIIRDECVSSTGVEAFWESPSLSAIRVGSVHG